MKLWQRMNCEAADQNIFTSDDFYRYTILKLLLRMYQLCNIEWQTILILNNYSAPFENILMQPLKQIL
jgi:hypothetical protein